MKLRWLGGLFALSLLGLSSAQARPLVIGHRGTGVNDSENPFVENTLPSIRQGFLEGADLVEIDIQLARTGEIILWHDEKVPTADGRKRPRELSPAQFPILQGPTGARTQVPTLSQVMDLAKEVSSSAKPLDIEIKIYEDEDRAPLVEALVRLLQKRRFARKVLVSSFDLEALALLEEKLPGIETGLLGTFKASTLRRARGALERGIPLEWVLPGDFLFLKGEMSFVEYQAMTSRYVRKVHDLGLKAGVWTINKERKLRSFLEQGYDAIITDEPPRARAIVDAEEAAPE